MTTVVNSLKTVLATFADRTMPVAKTPVPDGPVRWGPAIAAGAFFVAQIGAALWASTFILGLDWDGPRSVTQLLVMQIGLWCLLLGVPLLASKTKGNSVVGDFGVRWERPDIPFGLAAGALLQLIAIPVLYFPIGLLTDEDPSAAAEELFANRSGSLDLAILIFMVVVVAPLVEELFYRGLILRGISVAMGPLAGVVGSAAIFAFAHGQLLQAPGLFLFGLCTGYLAHRTGRLAPGWALHAAFNATSVGLLVL